MQMAAILSLFIALVSQALLPTNAQPIEWLGTGVTDARGQMAMGLDIANNVGYSVSNQNMAPVVKWDLGTGDAAPQQIGEPVNMLVGEDFAKSGFFDVANQKCTFAS